MTSRSLTLPLLSALICIACSRAATDTPAPGPQGGALGGPDAGDAHDPSETIDADFSDCGGGQPFADPVVEAAVRAETGRLQGPLSAAELASVVLLRAPGATSLAGVECLPGLSSLIGYGGAISDLSPLTRLDELRTVDLADNRVQSLSPLSGHPLRNIDVSDNLIASLDDLLLPEGGCEQILDLQRNPIEASRVEPFCHLEWVVMWGGEGGADPEQCNLLCL